MRKKHTIDSLRLDASKERTRSEFKKNNLKAYRAAIRLGVLNEICQHMDIKKKHWTVAEISAEALKYSFRTQFIENNPAAYHAAYRQGILDKICSHMVIQPRYGVNSPSYKYTDEQLHKKALLYLTKNDFEKNDSVAYNLSLRRGILEQICKHMIPLHKTWTFEKLHSEALKYTSRAAFKKNNPSAYAIARIRKVLDKICSHMTAKCIYRTNKDLYQEALKYESRSDFARKNPNAYNVSLRRGIMDRICTHMTQARNTSFHESALFELIKKNFPKTQKLRDRKVKIEGKTYIHGFDIDLYIPELRRGIEFDGDYWHSVPGLKRSRQHWPEDDLVNYHKLKDNWFKAKGIEILHIKEEDWLKDSQSCINKCLEFLKK